MFFRSLVRLPVSLLALLPLASLVQGDCYVAAYGLIGKQSGWTACPGTATSPGGAESCCIPGSECGEDSICHVPASGNPGSNAWYVAGCTDSSYSDPVCNKACVDYTQTYIQYEDSSGQWMCCGSGGCNGTTTDATFSGPSPQDWTEITGSSAPSSTAASLTSTNSPTAAASSNQGTTTTAPPSSNSATGASSGSNSATTKETSKKTSRTVAISSGDFKPSPIHAAGQTGASATSGAHSSNSTPASSKDGTNSQNGSNGGLSTGAEAGIGVAIGVAGLALIVGLIAVFMLRKNRKAKEQGPDEVRIKTETAPPYSPYSPYNSSELQGSGGVSELPTNPPVYEVGGAENEVRHQKWRPWQ